MPHDPGVDEELVLIDQVQSVELGGELAAAQEHACRGRVLEFLHPKGPQVAGDVMAVALRGTLNVNPPMRRA